MFTGIVERVGTVEGISERGGVRDVVIRVGRPFCRSLEPGSSVAVDGACLTVRDQGDDSFVTEIIGTTLSRTVAGHYHTGSQVNLERALPVGGRLEGHLVQGHVDAVGELVSIEQTGAFRLLDFRIPPAVHRLTILHGSIALNGVSLTVNDLDDHDRCQVALITHTWRSTNLRFLRPGDPVNVEGDLIGKYVGKLLRRSSGRERILGPEDSPGTPHQEH